VPTYEYQCPACGNRFDLFQRMSDPPGAACPACGAAAERILSGGAGFLFKGEGFYITDYRSDDYRKRAAAESRDSGTGKGMGKEAAAGKGGKSEGAASTGAGEGTAAPSREGGTSGGSGKEGSPAGGTSSPSPGKSAGGATGS